jgi:hypothetical protein
MRAATCFPPVQPVWILGGDMGELNVGARRTAGAGLMAARVFMSLVGVFVVPLAAVSVAMGMAAAKLIHGDRSRS